MKITSGVPESGNSGGWTTGNAHTPYNRVKPLGVEFLSVVSGVKVDTSKRCAP